MIRDIRYSIRSLLSTPAVTGAAFLVLAVGIGATTAIFSVANSVLFQPLPFAHPERLVQFGTVGVLEFRAYQEHSRSFTHLVFYAAVDKDLQDAGGPERIRAIAAERTLFAALGVQPLAGRTFSRTDAMDVAVVSEGFWRRRLGGQAIDGRKIALDGAPYTVVGVMPARFQFPYRTTMTDVWIPAALPRTTNPFQRIDVAIGRLQPHATVETTRAELSAIAQRTVPLLSERSAPSTLTMTPLPEAVMGPSRSVVLTLLGAVVMVLLIACANVASLLLARAETRKREVAVRTALGAGRGRLLRELLTESLLLATAATAAALLFAIAGTKALLALALPHIPRAFEIGLDWTAFLFLLAVGLSTGVAFGLAPALHATKPDGAGVLNAVAGRGSCGRGAVAMTRTLVVVEIAFAFILLAGAGLLFRALLSLQQAPTGIAAEHVLTVRMDTRRVQPQAAASHTNAALSTHGRYFRSLEERVRQIPGVRAAGFVTRLHVQSAGNTATFGVIGRPAPGDAEGTPVRLREVSTGYFHSLGIPLRAGRWFTDGERGILVNEALVREHFAGEDPIGRALTRGTIVGVVGDVRQRLRVPAEPEIYNPIARTSYSAATLVVNAEGPAAHLVEQLRHAIREVSPSQSVFDIRMMEDVIRSSYADVDLSFMLIGLFAAIAFALSMAGIYGVLSYAVTSRRKELGIRLALGADPARLVREILAQGGRLVGVGVIIGIAGALAVTRLLASLLYEVTPTDPVTFGAAGLVLVGIAMVACLNPARRAMKLDPMIVLRHE